MHSVDIALHIDFMYIMTSLNDRSRSFLNYDSDVSIHCSKTGPLFSHTFVVL